MSHSSDFHKHISLAGSLIAIGIVFGDIGTSPLYTLNAVFHNHAVTKDIALGAFSAIFWTLFFQTTLKYVIITLQADNKGEGGIFSLYALIRRYWGKWLIFPAMAGGAFLIADGIITPPISVASAVEGLQKVMPEINTVPIVIGILIGLFLFQQFGTDKIGKIFGPIMTIWFTFIGGLGIWALKDNWSVLEAINPYYAYKMLVAEPSNFYFLGAIFLCTTGAEALYSDMGHCGRNNIRVSWIYVKITLLLCYAGQTAWLMNHADVGLGGISPFYHIVPENIYWFALVLATLATIIASQALISGCFTLINEAIRLDIWPRHLVNFPGKIKGQLYVPFFNWFLMIGCISMVLYFKESTKMEAAFGLSVTLTMLMSTILINFYLHARRVNFFAVALITGIFLCIEIAFLIANLQKIKDGGWITLVIGLVLFSIMYIWWRGRRIKKQITSLVPFEKYLPLLKRLSMDESIPKLTTNLVYLTSSLNERKIEQTIVNSIFHSGKPKRADIYWFVHVNVLDEPYAMKYTVDTVVKNDVYFITFNLGFRIEPRIDYYFRQVVSEMAQNKEVDVSSRCEYSYQQSSIGDFRFVVMDGFLSYDNDMPRWKLFLMKSYYNLKQLSVKESVNFGLDRSNLIEEVYPVVVQKVETPQLTRAYNNVSD
jgi:KUP system potassium uptake protein